MILVLAILATATMGSAAEAQRSVILIDPATSPGVEAWDPVAVADSGFRDFAARFLDGVGATAVGLTFVRIPLTASGPEPVVGAQPVPEGAGGCRVESPWLDVVVLRKGGRGDARLAGTVYWSERQIARDRAFLAGSTTEGAAPRESFARPDFDAAAAVYAAAMIGRRPGEGTMPEAPPELSWLFALAPQSTRGPFAETARGEMRRVAAGLAPAYADLAVALVARCLGPEAAGRSYSDIGEAITATGVFTPTR